MRLVVELNRCQGYAQCVFLAPEVFELRGNEALHYDPNPDDAQRLRVLRAAAACPRCRPSWWSSWTRRSRASRT
jgi:ferredoxin